MSSDNHPFSWSAIFRIITAGIAVYLIWKSMSIIVAILVSVMLATALFPIVTFLNRKLPSVLSTLFVVLLLIIPFILLGATAIPAFIRELPDLLDTVDNLINNSPFLPEPIKQTDISRYTQNAATYFLQSTGLITNTITSILTVLFLTFYLIFDSKKLIELFLSLFPRNKRKDVSILLMKLAQINGQYIRGNLVISAICTITIFAGLSLLKVPFAMPLAIFAGLMDLLPLIGSTIALIPALIIGFSISPLTGLLVIALFLIYQQIENSIIAPMVYKQTLDLSAALSFLAVIIGSSLFGIVGAFLALPVAASLPVIIKYYREDGEEHTALPSKQKPSVKQALKSK